MSRTVSVRELRDHIGPLLDHVVAGEQLVVTRRGKSIARIVPEKGPGAGAPTDHPLRGSVLSIGEAFDEPIPGLWEDLGP